MQKFCHFASKNIYKWPKTLLREHFCHVGMILSQHFSDCFRINDNTNLTGQISDQLSGIHSGNLETEKQFCFDIAPDRHFIDSKHEIIRIYESSIIFDTIAPNQGGIAYE